MALADCKGIDMQRMQPVLVDADGHVWPVTSPLFWMRSPHPEGNIVDYAVSKLGCIHIWPIDTSSIVVSLRPDLVHPKAMAAAFYAIADLQPIRVYITARNTTRQGWELFDSFDRALHRIDRLVNGARRSAIGIQILRLWSRLRMNDKPPACAPRRTPSCRGNAAM